MEGVVHSGWLVKSPPEKTIFKAKWRQRWFVLRHSGLLPGQFVLEYFMDNACKKLKGRIDLDQCEQVDAGLTFESKKTSYQFMFDIRTPKRVYYLVAETESEMNRWVECICSVCGLKIHIEEDFLIPQGSSQHPGSTAVPSTNLTETQSLSNPYIPISECHTGKPVVNGKLPSNENLRDLSKEPPSLPAAPSSSLSQWSSLDHVALSDEFYDHPKPLKLSSLELEKDNDKENVANQLQPAVKSDHFNTLPSSGMSWNIFLDDPVPLNASTVPRSTKIVQPEYDVPNPVSQCSVQNLMNHFEKLSVAEPSPASSPAADASIPPRPPKPSKLRDRSCYENFKLPLQMQKENNEASSEDLSPSTKVPLGGHVDDTYDFPRFRNEDTTGRQRRHAYTNAAPGLFNSKDLIFNYECRPGLLNSDTCVGKDAPPSPSGNGAYANVPTSPTFVPPAVNRDLKPKRNDEKGSFSVLTLEPPPGCRSRSKGSDSSIRKPSPTQSPNLNSVPPLPNRFRAQTELTATSDDESSSSSSRRNSSTDDQARQLSKKDEIQYLDLDLDSEPSPSPKSPERLSASTVYKKVDFLKTKAFNEMRHTVEETYRKSNRE